MRNYLSVYSIYDKKQDLFTGIYSAVNDNVFMRDIYSMIKSDMNNLLFQFPDDFEVFCLADFNMNTGNAVSDVQMDDFPYSLGTIYDIMQKFDKAGVKSENEVSDKVD